MQKDIPGRCATQIPFSEGLVAPAALGGRPSAGPLQALP